VLWRRVCGRSSCYRVMLCLMCLTGRGADSAEKADGADELQVALVTLSTSY
jgi:hypothetical protein